MKFPIPEPCSDSLKCMILLTGIALCPTMASQPAPAPQSPASPPDGRAALPPNATIPTKQQDEAEFESIFNGKDFTGWGGPVYAYEVKEGAIVCRPDDGGTIYTRKRYSDFILRFEFKLPSGGESGLALRYPGSGNPAYVGMCKIQIREEPPDADEDLDPRQLNGSAYGLAAAKPGFLRAPDQWNFAQVAVRGSTVKVELNEVTVLDTDLSEISEFMANHPHPGKNRTSGHLGITSHTVPVYFRNLRLMELR